MKGRCQRTNAPRRGAIRAGNSSIPAKPHKARSESNGNANLGFEAKLWAAADALRNNMDAAEYILYEEPDGRVRLDVRLEQDTVWLTQVQMAELFGRERSVITKHINKVFGEGELAKESNVQNLHIASSDKQEKATETVLEQAALLSAEWAIGTV